MSIARDAVSPHMGASNPIFIGAAQPSALAGGDVDGGGVDGGGVDGGGVDGGGVDGGDVDSPTRPLVADSPRRCSPRGRLSG